MTIEEMLQQSGDFGPAQWWLLTLFCATNILSAFHYFALTFISLVPPVLCSSNQTSVDFGSDAESDWNGFQFKSITMEVRKAHPLLQNWAALIYSFFYLVGLDMRK